MSDTNFSALARSYDGIPGKRWVVRYLVDFAVRFRHTVRPAPKLKDAVLTQEQYEKGYVQCLKMMRRMFHRCKLVHADLSEYNILYLSCVEELSLLTFSYYKNRMYFIDVSQSVEHDHPNSLQFLRKVCSRPALRSSFLGYFQHQRFLFQTQLRDHYKSRIVRLHYLDQPQRRRWFGRRNRKTVVYASACGIVFSHSLATAAERPKTVEETHQDAVFMVHQLVVVLSLTQ